MRRFTLVPLAGPEDSNSSFGNQLFQLSFGLFRKLNKNENVHFYLRSGSDSDRTSWLPSQNLPITSLISPDELVGQSPTRDVLLTMALRLMPNSDQGHVQEFNSYGAIHKIGQIQIASGYFQNHKFVNAVKKELLTRFQASHLFRALFSSDREHLTIHVRRGDYISKPKNISRYGILSAGYYLDAVSYLATKCDFQSIVIVSDDPRAAWDSIGVHLEHHSHLKVEMGVGTLVEDFCTLASSRGVVISNSTFSWWGAWMASVLRDAAVALPAPWYLDDSGSATALSNPGWFQIPR